MRNRLYIPLPFASTRFRFVPYPPRFDVTGRSYAQVRKYGAILFYMGGRITSRRIDTRYQHITPLCRYRFGAFGAVAVRCAVAVAVRFRAFPFRDALF